MSGYFTESNYENAVLQLLNDELGYTYVYGPEVERDYHSPLYEDVLLPSLQRINKSLPMDALTEAIYKLKNFETGTLLQVEDMPLFVIIDSDGNNLYEMGRKEYL